jgi:hypothetical protein
MPKILQRPLLEYLSDANISLRFKFDPQLASFEDIRVHTKDLDISGFFNLNANELVASQISVFFSKRIFSEIPFAQRALRLIPQMADLPFELRLSGDVHQMNFQWEDSILKRKVENRLPNFIERFIDRKVDEKMSV